MATLCSLPICVPPQDPAGPWWLSSPTTWLHLRDQGQEWLKIRIFHLACHGFEHRLHRVDGEFAASCCCDFPVSDLSLQGRNPARMSLLPDCQFCSNPPAGWKTLYSSPLGWKTLCSSPPGWTTSHSSPQGWQTSQVSQTHNASDLAGPSLSWTRWPPENPWTRWPPRNPPWSWGSPRSLKVVDDFHQSSMILECLKVQFLVVFVVRPMFVAERFLPLFVYLVFAQHLILATNLWTAETLTVEFLDCFYILNILKVLLLRLRLVNLDGTVRWRECFWYCCTAAWKGFVWKKFLC